MDDRYNNIDPDEQAGMNGHRESMRNDEQARVFSELFALDQQPDPSPRFVSKLGQSLMPSAGRMRLLSTTTPFEDSIPLAQPLTHEAGGGRRRPPILSFGSAAVLMVVVVLVGYMVALWAVDGQSGDGSNFALASTFEATGTAEATSDCYIEPRELGYILMIIEYAMTGDPNGLHGRPEADLGTPWPPAEAPDTQSIYGSWPEAGEPAGAETTNRVNEVYSQYIACSNENDELRAYALFTNDGLARRFVPDGVLELRLVAGLPTSDLSETEQPRGAGWQFEGFERVEMLPDGRAVGYLPDSGGAIIFRLVDGRWLIDDMNVGRG